MATPWKQKNGEVFQTTISAGSIEERDQRIADLTIKGFEVVRYFERVEDDRRVSSVNRRRCESGEYKHLYGAILRRANKCQ